MNWVATGKGALVAVAVAATFCGAAFYQYATFLKEYENILDGAVLTTRKIHLRLMTDRRYQILTPEERAVEIRPIVNLVLRQASKTWPSDFVNQVFKEVNQKLIDICKEV